MEIYSFYQLQLKAKIVATCFGWEVWSGKFRVLKKQKEFSIRKALTFSYDGKTVEVKFVIDQNGFVLDEVTNGPAIETFEVKQTWSNPNEVEIAVSNDILAFEFVNKDSFELTDMKK
ncbi:unnamed protein product, partial [Diamesa serratosioi]